MKKFIAGILLTLLVLWIFRTCSDAAGETASVQEQSDLIRARIEQVSKLVVTEGHYAEVFTYEDSRELFGSLITADKKALVVVNARASVIYDLKKVEYRLDPDSQTLEILRIPEPEIDIQPDIEYYDVSADYLNPFAAGDYNAIKNQVSTIIRRKVEASDLRSNARNRLLSELADFWVLTRSMGWTLVYDDRPLETLPGPELLPD